MTSFPNWRRGWDLNPQGIAPTAFREPPLTVRCTPPILPLYHNFPKNKSPKRLGVLAANSLIKSSRATARCASGSDGGRHSWAVVRLPRETLRESREDSSDHLAMVREEALLGKEILGCEHSDLFALVPLGLHLRESRETRPEDGEDVVALVQGVHDREVALRQGHADLLLQLPNGATLGRLRDAFLAPTAGQLPEDRGGLLGVTDDRDALGRNEQNGNGVSFDQGTPPLWI